MSAQSIRHTAHDDRRHDSYRWIAPIYDPMVGPFLRPARVGVRQVAGRFGCRRILDIACGTGEQARMLTEAGFTAAGIDLSPAMLSIAQAKAHPRSVFFQGDARKMPLEAGAFDCVCISLSLHEMDYSSAVEVVEDAMRVLTPDGKLVVFDYAAPDSFTARVGIGLFHVVERLAGKRHFRNFTCFLARGGLASLLERFPLKTVMTRKYFGGAAALTVAERWRREG